MASLPHVVARMHAHEPDLDLELGEDGEAAQDHVHDDDQVHSRKKRKVCSAFETDIVPNPPDLAAWRDKLFNVSEQMVLTEAQ